MSADGSPDVDLAAVARTLAATGRRGLALGILLGIVGVVVFLPLAHELLYGLLVAAPGTLQWLVVGGLGTAVWARRASDPQRVRFAVVAGGTVTLVLALVVAPWVGGIYTSQHLADEMSDDTRTLEALPNTSSDHVRLLPREVADQYAESSVQFPQHRTSESDIAYYDGRYHWSYALVPDNPFVSVFGTQRGALYVDMERADKRVTIRETEFQTGRGQLFTDSFTYRTTLDRLDVAHDPATAFVFERNGQAHIAQSYIRHEWHVRLFPFPQLYAVPRFGGVQVVDQDGSVRSIPADRVPSVDLLAGQNVYPYRLTRLRVRATNYELGYLNLLFAKEDVLQLASLPAGGNDWPVTVPTGSQGSQPALSYYIATEPTGSGSGVYEIYVFDGQTGAASVVEYDAAQIGPTRATKFVRQTERVARLSDVRVVEPTPVVRNDTLFWQVRVIPSSANGITFTGFVNADSGQTTLVSKTSEVRAFVAGDGIRVDDRDGGDSGTVVTITVTNEDGEVVSSRNVTVPENGSVGVQVSRNETG